MALSRVINDLDAGGDDGDEQYEQSDDEDIEAEHWAPSRRRLARPVIVSL
jgi:hypothetical protein